MRLLLLLLVLLAVYPVGAVERVLDDPAAEARAVALGDKLRCVVCQSETINDSGADMARDMRQLIRDKITAGWDDQRIIAFIHDRYGDYILLKPPFQANTWLLWGMPAVILICAVLAARAVFHRRETTGT